MTETMLNAAGIPNRETRFPSPPPGTYAVWMEDITADGPDGFNRIFTHDATVEIYASAPDPKAEADFEQQLDANGLHYEKQARYWLRTEQRYQTIYDFTYIEKI